MDVAQSWNWFDWVLVLMLASGLFYGWARGLVAVLVGFSAYLISLILAGRLTPIVVGWLDTTWGATAKVAATLSERIALPPEASLIPASMVPWRQAMPLLAPLPLPEAYKTQLAMKVETWSQAGANQSLAAFITSNLAAGIVSAVVFLLLVSLLGYAMALVGRLVSSLLSEIPLVGTLNRALGALVGVLGTAISLSVLLSLLTPLFGLEAFGTFGAAASQSTVAPSLMGLYEVISKWLFGQGGSYFFSI